MVWSKKLVARFFPRHSKLVQAINENALFIKWARSNEGCRLFATQHEADALSGFYQYVNDTVAGKNGPIDFLEFGVATGRSLRLWLGINTHPGSRFHGFDTFYGLPEDWRWAVGGMPKGSYSTNGKVPGIREKRVRFIKGLFQDRLPTFLERYRPRNKLIVHLDCDLYTSTLFTLTQLDPFLAGAVVVFDEFDNLLHEFAAFKDYVSSYRRAYKVLARLDYFKKAAIQIMGRS